MNENHKIIVARSMAALAAAFLLIALGVAINMRAAFLNDAKPAVNDQVSDAEESPAPAAGEPIERFMKERAQLRERSIEEMDQIIEDANTSEEMRNTAQRQKLELLEWMEQETTLEGILRARGYEESVVTVHRDSVNVLVRAESLTRKQTSYILDLVSRETGQTGGNIKIIPLN